MNGQYQKPYRLGRRPGEQGPRPLSWNQDRVEKLATGTTTTTYTKTTTTTPQTSTQATASKYDSDKLKLMKDTFTVGTWNVRTLWATGKLELLRNEMKRYSYDVIGISEVRWTGKGETTNGDFIWCGGDNTHTKGVGMLLSTRARKALMGYNPINPRLITARFKATPFNLTIINVYAPTSDATENEIEIFYSDLEDAIGKTPKKDILILTGDWNAKVGDDNTGWETAMGRYGYGTRNERGENLLEFATLHNLFICNTRFQQKPIHKWTWESPDGIHKNMIDLIIIQKRWKSSVVNCRTFQGADISSDHSLVLCNIKLRLKNIQNKPKYNQRLNIQQLNDQTIKTSYQTHLENNLNNIQTANNIDDHALQIEKAIKEALQVSIPTQKETPKKPWISTQTLDLANEKRKAKQVKHISTQLNNKYKHLCNEVKKAARKDKDNWIQNQCEEIQMGLKVGNSKQAYNLVKLLKKKFQPKLTVIRDQGGTIIQSKQGIMERWTEYCGGLYEDNGGGEKVVEELVNISPSNDNTSYGILYNEVQIAINKLKKNKSPGTDEITAEMIQGGGEQLAHKIHELCNRAWEEETIPEEWGRSILVPIPKKGDTSECSNYRTISLINHTGKVFLMVLLNRLKQHLDPYMSEEQAGFRKDRNTTHQILILRLLAEKAKRNGKKIYNCFVDFTKAFDTIKHNIMWAVLRSYGVDNKVITLLEKIYGNSRSAVRIGSDIGEWFQTSVGTRQGDPLSPLLFIAYLERIMDKTTSTNNGANLSGTLVSNLRFADDIDLISENHIALQEQIQQLTTTAAEAGLLVNTRKTKTMVFGGRTIDMEMEIQGTTIENVEEFEYLGSLLTWDNDCSKEIRRRINKAIGAMASLKHIWNTKKIKIENKLKILTTCVFSVLLYACDTWTLKEGDKKKLLAFEMRCYRRLLRISWKDMVRNIDIRKQIGAHETIVDKIKRRKLKLFGHVCRMDDNRLLKHVVFSRINGKSRRGRPCREWLDDITEWCGYGCQDLVHLAQSRDQWKGIIRSVVGPNGR
ncbi:unnamed protein product [Adineta ricciae]|uniref:Reverse transcriptase domain-containing protein n=1 Tax=Adineta ricciae TaxID=249248 RepID=A0A815KXJ2_ADIRI|nr:unnamed protein product [Adineta ricciae]CAF1402212.1 unnamed protein product [Adineta ricciae]